MVKYSSIEEAHIRHEDELTLGGERHYVCVFRALDDWEDVSMLNRQMLGNEWRKKFQ